MEQEVLNRIRDIVKQQLGRDDYIAWINEQDEGFKLNIISCMIDIVSKEESLNKVLDLIKEG